MLEHGYAEVTSRKVAAAAGMTQPLFFYYFRTMDDLFLSVFRRMAEQDLERLDGALKSQQPLRELWNLSSDPSRTALTMEFVALSNHRKLVQAEIARFAEQSRTMQVKALTRLFEQRHIQPQIEPLVVTVLLTGLARNLVQEDALGISKGHTPTLAFVEACLSFFEQMGAPSAPVLEMIKAQEAHRSPPEKLKKPRTQKAKSRV